MAKVLVVATSRKTRGGITSVVKAHETGEQWKKYHCRWIETHRDGNAVRKILYFITALIEFILILPWYDIIHIHTADGASARRKVYFAKIAKLCRKKIIVHFHPPSPNVLLNKEVGPPIREIFSYADKLIVLSPQWQKWICEAYKGNMYDFEVLLNPCPIVKRCKDLNSEEKYILYAGKLSERKGYNRLLKAFAVVADEFPSWKLKFAGNGLIKEGMELGNRLGVTDKQVEFLGWISGDEKDYVFSNASIYCLPSRGEGFPMGVLDAVAYGVPVITTPVGGIVDVMCNGIDCLMFNTENIDELVECLRSLMINAELRRRIVVQADKLRDHEFNIVNICKQLDNLYAKM